MAESGLQTSGQANILERADSDKLQRISRGGNQPVLDSPGRADKEDFGGVVLFQLIRDGQRRDDVSARTSASENCAHVVTINEGFSIIYRYIDIS